MSLEILDEALQQILVAVGDALVVTRATAAAVAWFLWDMIITFDQEVKYIWKRRFSLYQILYLLLRYGTLVALMSVLIVQTDISIKYNVKFCLGYHKYFGFAVLYPPFCGEALIVLRLYALYGQSRKILAFCLFVFVGRMATLLYVIVAQLQTITVITPDIPFTGCVATPPTNPYLAIVTVTVSMITGSVFFFLTLYKFISTMPRTKWRHVGAMREATPLVQLLLRDASAYLAAFLLAETVLLIYTIGYPHRLLSRVGMLWFMATYAIAGTRLVLSLRAEITPNEEPIRWRRPPIELPLRRVDRAPTGLILVDSERSRT